MENINLSIVDASKIDELLTKINKIHEILQGEKTQPDKLYSNSEASKYLKVCNKTLQNYRDTGQIRFIQNGRKIMYSQIELNEFLLKNKKQLFIKTTIKLN